MDVAQVEKNCLEILSLFTADSLENPMQELERFKEGELSFYIRIDKFDSSINAPVAQLIIDFQNSIYKIIALALKGEPNTRLLSVQEKGQFEIPFMVSGGSTTIGQAKGFLKIIKELLELVPKNQRGTVLVLVVIVVFSYLSWDRYLDHSEIIHQSELEYYEKIQQTQVIDSAITKLSEQNPDIVDVLQNIEKQTLNSLSKVDDTITINENKYTSTQLKEIKRKKPLAIPKKELPQIVPSDLTGISGEFSIAQINLKDSYILVEKFPDMEAIEIYYDAKDQHAQILDQLHKAIDNRHRRFQIEATAVNSYGKKRLWLFEKFQEVQG